MAASPHSRESAAEPAAIAGLPDSAANPAGGAEERLRFGGPFGARIARAARGTLIWTERLAWTVFFLFALTVLALRYVVLPGVEKYRTEIETALTRAAGHKVSIGSVQAGWDGLYPGLDLRDVVVHDAKNRAALRLPYVSITLSWWSVPAMELRLHALDIANADLDIRRARDGKLSVGGLELRDDASGGQMSDWILGQRRIVIRESRLRWNDEQRGAPELALSDIHLVARNTGSRHRVALRGTPPRQLANTLDLRADLHGESLGNLAVWRGDLYADLAAVDLAAWRAWVDYPADVKSGSGSLRTWLSFDHTRLTQFTADVSLNNTLVQLRRDLAPLQLSNVQGRLGARELLHAGTGFSFLRFGAKSVAGFEVSGKQVTLTTNDGVRLAPADFTMQTFAANAQGKTPGAAPGSTANAAGSPGEVRLQANALNLEPVVKIAELLPLDAQLRKTLIELEPHGTLHDFQIEWKGDFDQPSGFKMRGRFQNLALRAYQAMPGFSQLSGSVDASEKGGTLYLASRDAAILLPQVFEEPHLVLDTLDAGLSWGFPNGQLEVKLDQLIFANTDAAGNMSATYRALPDTPGYIDLTGRLTRASATAVYRYMPKKLSDNIHRWVKDAVEGGQSSDVRFKVRGNLFDFPFIDPRSGDFQVAIKLEGGRLFYADAWPRASDIKGDLVFERNGMWFKGGHGNAASGNAVAGTILGAKINQFDLKIAAFDVRPAVVELGGNADGPTPEFLKFVAQSPVAGYVDHFTDNARAAGNGKLALKLALPLGGAEALKIVPVRFNGQYTFVNNEVMLDDGLPKMERVNGVLAFSERGVELRNLRGEGVGGSFTLAGGTRPNGSIAVTGDGSFTVPGVAAWLKDPVFGSMTGGAPWRATINIGPRGRDIMVDSTMAGVAINLPAPVNKAAAETWPMRFVETRTLGATEDEWNFTLGRAITARLLRREENGVMRVVRAAAGVNETMPALPRSGLAVNAAATSVDVDDWRVRAFGAKPAAASGAAPTALAAPAAAPAAPAAPAVPATPAVASVASLPAPWQIQLRADTLNAFGRQLHQVRVNMVQEPARWVANLASTEANGTLAFILPTLSSQGRFAGQMRNLVIPVTPGRTEDTPLDRIGDDMPAVDLLVEDFQLGDKKLGKLEIVANNIAGEWKIQTLNLTNPDGALTATGAWRRALQTAPGTAARRPIALDFTLNTPDSGKLLDRLGFPNTVRAGSGYLKGNIGWEGSPTSIDYASLRGDLELRIEKGQFLKADPGVGKLLGIMSLQALPRRLTLDFRDVFSEGFPYDLVSASSKIERGILSTNDFRMTGVSAAVLMTGDTDLAREIQNLKVVVLPDLSGGMVSVVGVITGIINPLSALASYLAQRVLKDPLSKAFSFEYAVTGSWADPKIARIQTLPQAQGGDSSAFPGTGAVAAGSAAGAGATGGVGTGRGGTGSGAATGSTSGANGANAGNTSGTGTGSSSGGTQTARPGG